LRLAVSQLVDKLKDIPIEDSPLELRKFFSSCFLFDRGWSFDQVLASFKHLGPSSKSKVDHGSSHRLGREALELLFDHIPADIFNLADMLLAV
jgi:hypothetical protein